MNRACAILLILFSAALNSAGWAQDSPPAMEAFQKLQNLVGNWEAKLESGKVIAVNYKLMSSGSILVETFRTPSGKETLTVYHLDRDRLLFTHYCAQGNQPRLRYEPDRSTATTLAFSFWDSTNLTSKKMEHMVALKATLLDADHFDQTFTYRAGREEETTTLHFVRKPS
jgi:hypothetical protein